MIRVAVVAGSAVLRAGLEALLASAPALVVVGSLDPRRAADVIPLAELVAPLAPDVVVWVPDESAEADADWLAPLRADDGPPLLDHGVGTSERGGGRIGAGVVLLGGVSSAQAAAGALRAGARAVLAREAAADEIVAAVEATAAGLVTLPAVLADELLAAVDRAEATGPVGGTLAPPIGVPALTAREREVLALLARGMANKAIAPVLGISEHTVKAHVAAIFEKLGAGTRAEAVVIAARSGLLLL